MTTPIHPHYHLSPLFDLTNLTTQLSGERTPDFKKLESIIIALKERRYQEVLKELEELRKITPNLSDESDHLICLLEGFAYCCLENFIEMSKKIYPLQKPSYRSTFEKEFAYFLKAHSDREKSIRFRNLAKSSHPAIKQLSLACTFAYAKEYDPSFQALFDSCEKKSAMVYLTYAAFLGRFNYPQGKEQAKVHINKALELSPHCIKALQVRCSLNFRNYFDSEFNRDNVYRQLMEDIELLQRLTPSDRFTHSFQKLLKELIDGKLNSHRSYPIIGLMYDWKPEYSSYYELFDTLRLKLEESLKRTSKEGTEHKISPSDVEMIPAESLPFPEPLLPLPLPIVNSDVKNLAASNVYERSQELPSSYNKIDEILSAFKQKDYQKALKYLKDLRNSKQQLAKKEEAIICILEGFAQLHSSKFDELSKTVELLLTFELTGFLNDNVHFLKSHHIGNRYPNVFYDHLLESSNSTIRDVSLILCLLRATTETDTLKYKTILESSPTKSALAYFALAFSLTRNSPQHLFYAEAINYVNQCLELSPHHIKALQLRCVLNWRIFLEGDENCLLQLEEDVKLLVKLSSSDGITKELQYLLERKDKENSHGFYFSMPSLIEGFKLDASQYHDLYHTLCSLLKQSLSLRPQEEESSLDREAGEFSERLMLAKEPSLAGLTDAEMAEDIPPVPIIPSNHEMTPVESASIPEEPMRPQPSINIDPKYLHGEKVKEIRPVSQRLECEWLKNPDLKLLKVAYQERQSAFTRHVIETNAFRGTYLTSASSLPVPTERCTFVMMGRKENAHVPKEHAGGRIILVVPSTDLAQAEFWTDSHTDVLLIESFKRDFIPTQATGLIMARRYAALSFAYERGLSGLIMIDDNLENFYISADICPKEQADWEHVYRLFEQAADRHGVECLSARTYRPEIDLDKPKGVECDVIPSKVGSKIFYMNIQRLKDYVSDPVYLFPEDPLIWGEDIMMQGAMIFAGASIGILDRQTLLFTRLKSHKNSCKKVVRPANAWMEYHSKTIRPEYTIQAENWIVAQVQRNISLNESKRLKAEHFDLGAFTTKRMTKGIEGKRQSESLLPLPLLLKEKPETVLNKKRKVADKVALEVEQAGLTHDLESPFIREFTQTCKFVQPNQITIGDQEFILSLPFRTWQYQALQSLGLFLEKSPVFLGHINAATAGGKTFVMAAVAAIGETVKASTNNVLIVTPTVQLVQQTYEALVKFNQSLSPQRDSDKLMMISNKHIPLRHLLVNKRLEEGGFSVIMCAASFANMLEKDQERLSLFETLIIDECHKIPKRVLSFCKEIAERQHKLVLNFSATPEHPELIGPCIFEYNLEEGVEQKILSPWIVDRLSLPYSKDNLEIFCQSWPLIQIQKKHPHGKTLRENKGFMYVKTVEEARQFEALLRENGVKAAALYHSKENKEAIIEEFKKNVSQSEVNLLILVEMLKLGFNGKVDYAIVARNDLSKSDWLQILGRTLRNHPPTSAGEQEPLSQKVAYLIVFQDAVLPGACIQPSKQVPLKQDYLAEEGWFGWSIRRNVISLYGPEEAPSSPALTLAFESADAAVPSAIPAKEVCVVPLPYDSGAFERAALLGALWHEEYANNQQVAFPFNTIRAVLGHPHTGHFRQKIRERNLVRESELFSLLDQASSQLETLISMKEYEAIKKQYQCILYTYNQEKNAFVLKEKKGNPKARQTICLYYSKERNGSNRPHFDLLIPAASQMTT